MTRKILVALTLLLINATCVAAKPQRPNVIVILSDDQGYGDYGSTGNPLLKTPNSDELAERGIWLDNFYVEPVCTPTRVGWQTGRHPFRNHVTWVGQQLHKDELTIGQAFKSAGYATGIFGKWGCTGNNYPLRPQDRGYDEVLIPTWKMRSTTRSRGPTG